MEEKNRTSDPFLRPPKETPVKRDLNPLPETSIKIKKGKNKNKNDKNEIDALHTDNFTNKTNLFIVNLWLLVT